MKGTLKTIKTDSQCGKILSYLQDGNSLTVMECLHKGWGANLRSRISNLEEAGYKIKREYLKANGTYIARYSLSADNNNE